MMNKEYRMMKFLNETLIYSIYNHKVNIHLLLSSAVPYSIFDIC
jgi:hypothetical protein